MDKKMIAEFKKWSLVNFLFLKNVVHYNDYPAEKKKLTKIPSSIIQDDSNIKYNIDEFDTPFTHLIHVLVTIGKDLEREDRKKRIAEKKKNQENK